MDEKELKALLETMRQENAAGQEETRRHFAVAIQNFEQMHAETRRHFDVVAERLDRRIDIVIETVAAVDEKLDRRTAEIEERMERGFADTQAMIRFSHAELERRVRTLEQGVADLTARVERLETTTH